MIGKFELLLNMALPEKAGFQFKFYLLFARSFQPNTNHAKRSEISERSEIGEISPEIRFVLTLT
jgi:hypothetical protein